MIRYDWTREEICELYNEPLFSLISRAHEMHRQFHEVGEMQVCKLVNFKTGGCTEDCKYCSQSIRYQTHVVPLPLKQLEEMLAEVDEAIEAGATRVCISAAWRQVRDGKAFETILSAVQKICERGIEVCCTLGMLTDSQAKRLSEAGLFAYNHNLDTSRSYYKEVITSRSYEERLATLDRVEKASLSVCSGMILGLGESPEDRVDMIHTLATRMPHPESVPINSIVPIKGTPLEQQEPIPIWDHVRMIAVCRITMPRAMIRLAGGRMNRSHEQQALCFFAGANALFSGDTLLTTPIYSFQDDDTLFTLLGLRKRAPFKKSAEPTPGAR